MIEDEFTRLLEKDWSEEERQMIQRIKEGLLYYKKLLPKSLKADVIAALQLCNNLKHQLECRMTKVNDLEKNSDIQTADVIDRGMCAVGGQSTIAVHQLK